MDLRIYVVKKSSQNADKCGECLAEQATLGGSSHDL